MEREAANRDRHPAVVRLLERGDVDPGALDALRSKLSGADLTSLLLDVMSHRAVDRSPGELMRQYERDRFTAPAAVDAKRLLTLQAGVAEAIGDRFELIETSPVAPLGTNAVVAGVAQNRVVSTMRSSEVIADPTTSLALEAAARRRATLRTEPRNSTPVRLAAIERVVRRSASREPGRSHTSRCSGWSPPDAIAATGASRPSR